MLLRYAFPAPRFGHDTNNILESTNNSWADIRRIPPITMMEAIYTLFMKTLHNRYKALQYNAVICNIPLAKFNNRLQQSRRYRVFESGNGIYQVQKPDSPVKFIVKIAERSSCTCTNLQEYCLPCSHAITACRYEAVDPFTEFVEAYQVEFYRLTYKHFLLPFSIEDLACNSAILPPI
jgi:hypothetical protein